FEAEDGIRDRNVTGVQTCALPILEKEMLGVYLSGHPLERYRRAIKKLGFDLSRITVETDESGESILNEEVLALDNKDIQFIGIKIGRASCREGVRQPVRTVRVRGQ